MLGCTDSPDYSPDITPLSLAAQNGDYQMPSGQGIGSWLACHEFQHSTTKDLPCREAMYVKSVESSTVLPLVWCDSQEKGRCQLRCRPRHLTMVQNDEDHHQNPRVAE
ncbi:uncharacterized protein TNCV_1728991 [Trichonephila clavipes]|nr:uncharacterized protein TNCV_1728991 [Trichonephila clavipes]